MKITLRKPSPSEIIKLHDSYFESSEPDAPKKAFADLNSEEQIAALNAFSAEKHLTALYEGHVVGFVGLYPDDEFDYLHIFAVIPPEHRGKKYFSFILASTLDYCSNHYNEYKFIAALTRKTNLPAIKGLQACAFAYEGTDTQKLGKDPDDIVTYEKFVLPMPRTNNFNKPTQ